MNLNTRTAGLILIIVGLVVGLVSAIWLVSGLLDDNSGLRFSGFMLGMALVLSVLVVPAVGGGLYLFMKGRTESQLFAVAERQRRMLGVVEAAGEIRVSDLALQLNTDRDTVRSDLYDLVSKGLFAGYINWDDGILFAKQASALRDQTTCPKCGGQLSLAGKGLVRCPYCGTEIFLP